MTRHETGYEVKFLNAAGSWNRDRIYRVTSAGDTTVTVAVNDEDAARAAEYIGGGDPERAKALFSYTLDRGHADKLGMVRICNECKSAVCVENHVEGH